MNHSAIGEQRREVRRPASGSVRLNFSNPEATEIRGTLLDVSANGFRMLHECTSLNAGQIVRFAHAEATGEAQIVWNRILPDRVESGFLIVGPNGRAAKPLGSV